MPVRSHGRSSAGDDHQEALPPDVRGLATRLGLSVDDARLVQARCERIGLTPRERESALLAIGGKRPARIAELLGVSQDTVKTLLRRAYRKAGVECVHGATLLLLWDARRD